MIKNLPDHGVVLLRFSRPQHTISYSLVILSEISHHHGLDSTRDKDGRTGFSFDSADLTRLGFLLMSNT